MTHPIKSLRKERSVICRAWPMLGDLDGSIAR